MNRQLVDKVDNECVRCPALQQKADRNEIEIERLWSADVATNKRVDGIKNLLIGLLGSSILTLIGVVATLIVAVK